MILSFVEFLKEHYTLSQVEDKSVDYADKAIFNNLINQLKDLSKQTTDISLKSDISNLIVAFEKKPIDDDTNKALHKEWNIIKLRYKDLDLEVDTIDDITSDKVLNTKVVKYKKFLMNKYHKDTNMKYEGDEKSPFLYHYTTLENFKGIIKEDIILGESDSDILISSSDDCKYCYSTGEMDCDECEGEGTLNCGCDDDCGECYGGLLDCDRCSRMGTIDCEECEGIGDVYDEESAGGACFTTDSDLYKKGFNFTESGGDATIGIKMKLNFEAIKANKYQYLLGSPDIGTIYAENEIRIKGGLNDVKKYLINVEIYPNKLAKNEEDYKEAIEFLKQHNIKYRIKA